MDTGAEDELAIYLQQVENDVFISYHRVKADQSEEGGWIKVFHEELYKYITEFVGYRASIWRDDYIEAGSSLKDILDNARGTAVFIAVLTEGYKTSHWCQDEIRGFYDSIKHLADDSIDHGTRVFKILRVPVAKEDQHPPELQDLKAYQFYEHEEGRPIPRKFYRPELSAESRAKFQEQTLFIAQDVSFIIKALKKKSHIPLTIYLPEPTPDLLDIYKKLKYQLQAWGYGVLPNRSLSTTVDSFKEEVTKYLSRCALSIHLIGHWYGRTPDDHRDSVIKLQNDLAEEHGEKHQEFSRLIWIPPQLQTQQPEQKEFIDSLESFSNSLVNPPKVLTNSTFQDLIDLTKDTIQEQLERTKTSIRKKKSKANFVKHSVSKRIYLIYQKSDKEEVTPVIRHLQDEGIGVIKPIFEDESVTLEEAEKRHEHNLRRSDATLIYWGKANENWLEAMLQDLDIIASTRSANFLARALYKGNPITKEKQQFYPSEFEVDYVFQSLTCETFKYFLDRIKAEEGEAPC